MNEQTNERKKKQTNERTNERTNDQTRKQTFEFSVLPICVFLSAEVHISVPIWTTWTIIRGCEKLARTKVRRQANFWGAFVWVLLLWRSIKCTCSKYVFLALVMQREMRMRRSFAYFHVWPVWLYLNCPHYLNKWHEFGKTSFVTKRVFRFSVGRGKFPSKNTTIIWLKWWYL